jgi:metal-responsive CopG/Arc/MetJ family transcriptional regulator
MIGVRLQPDQLAQIDAWAIKQDDAPSRPEAIRRLVRAALDAEAGARTLPSRD